MPAELFSCDVDELDARRQVVLDTVNHVMPKILQLLKTSDGVELRATNDNTHCTSS